MATVFNDQLGVTQGRIRPANHTPSTADSPAPARIESAEGPFALADGQTLLVKLNGGATQVITFDEADFVDITDATAAEIATEIDAQLPGVTATAVGDIVRVDTDTVGLEASLQIIGGTAAGELGFPTGLVSGTQGEWSFVLGCDTPGRMVSLRGGDQIILHQTAAFTGLDSVRITGAARITELPVGYEWELRVGVDTIGEQVLNLTELYDAGLDRHFAFSDIGFNASGVPGGDQTMTITLGITGPATTIVAEMPAIYIDFVEVEAEGDMFLVNRFPAPGQVGVSFDLDYVRVMLADTTGTGVNLAATQIRIEGVLAYDGGAGGFQAGYTGPLSVVTNPAGITSDDVEITIDVSALAVTSEQVIDVRVVSDVVAGTGIDETYSFTMADISQPQVTDAHARDHVTVRVSFNEAMSTATTGGGALNPDNYSFTALSAPAVPIDAIAVTQVTESVFDVTIDWEMSRGAEYELTVSAGLEDDDGNVVDEDFDTAEFTGYQCPVPAGRSFLHWDMMPGVNRREDDSGALRAFSLCLQDVIDLVLCSIDRFPEIVDIDLAPEDFVDALLAHLGNPFDFEDLTLIEKRRLARNLVDLYKQKGTEEGVINAIRLLTQIEVTLDILNFREDWWQLGVSELGATTLLAPGPGSPLWYSFWIDSPVVLTADQRARILRIATYMKGAHEHILGIREPGTITPATSFWELGVSLLGVDTLLGM